MGIVYVFDISSICFHGKRILRQFTLHQKYREQSQSSDNQMIFMEYDSSWKQLSLVSDDEVISLSHAKVCVFSDSVFCLGKTNENPQSNMAWEDLLTWFKSSPQYRALDTIDGEPMELAWNIFPRIHHIAALQQSPRVTVKIERNTRKIYWTDHLHVDVQRHLMGFSRQ